MVGTLKLVGEGKWHVARCRRARSPRATAAPAARPRRPTGSISSRVIYPGGLTPTADRGVTCDSDGAEHDVEQHERRRRQAAGLERDARDEPLIDEDQTR